MNNKLDTTPLVSGYLDEYQVGDTVMTADEARIFLMGRGSSEADARSALLVAKDFETTETGIKITAVIDKTHDQVEELQAI